MERLGEVVGHGLSEGLGEVAVDQPVIGSKDYGQGGSGHYLTVDGHRPFSHRS